MHHQANSCLMTNELICDEIAVGDNRELWSVFIHTHHRVWDSLHSAHAHCGGCPVHYQVCAKENNPDIINCNHTLDMD